VPFDNPCEPIPESWVLSDATEVPLGDDVVAREAATVATETVVVVTSIVVYRVVVELARDELIREFVFAAKSPLTKTTRTAAYLYA
jgi:hypothetical protein